MPRKGNRAGFPEDYVFPPGTKITGINLDALPSDVAASIEGCSIHATAARDRIQPERGRMNGLERKYAAEVLDIEMQAYLILRYDFEEEGLRLADRTFYYPDFRVIMPDLTIEFREVKGFWEDDALAKYKCAAERHPFRFVAIRMETTADGPRWIEEYRK